MRWLFPINVMILISLLGLTYASSADYIQIKELSSKIVEEVIRIDCEVSYQLDDSVKEALNNGIAIDFMLEIELMQDSPYWLDMVSSSIKREFEVKYHALSKQYVMIEAGSEVELSFPDLYSAFYYQRHLHNAVLATTDSLDSDKNYYIRARARLVSEQLPIPLRIKSYLYRGWRPSSGWTEWPM